MYTKDINNVVLSGRLVKVPELKVTPNGTSAIKATLATSTVKKNNEYQTAFVEFTLYGKPAEMLVNTVGKGDKITIVGWLNCHSYKKEDGTERQVTEISADSFWYGEKKKDDSQKPAAPDKDVIKMEDIDVEGDLPF